MPFSTTPTRVSRGVTLFRISSLMRTPAERSGNRYSPPVLNLSMIELVRSPLVAARHRIAEFPDPFAGSRPKAEAATELLATELLATELLATELLATELLATELLATELLAMDGGSGGSGGSGGT